MDIAIIGYGGMGGYHAELLHQFAAEGGASDGGKGQCGESRNMHE